MSKFFKSLLAVVFSLLFVGTVYGGVQLGDNRETDKEQQVIRVCKTGCVYSVIQDAIDSISDNSVTKQYNILIHAGIYEENVTLKSYVNLIGNGSADSIIIKETSGTLITTDTGISLLENLRLELNPTANGAILIDATAGGELRLAQTNNIISSSTNGITAQMIKADNNAAVFLLRSSTNYTMTGSAVGSNAHNIDQLLGNSSLIIVESDNSVLVNDVDDDYYWLRNQSTGVFLHVIPRYIVTHTNASYSGTFRMFRHEKLGISISQETSTMFFTGSGSGNAIVTSIDSDTNNALVDSNYNQIRVSGWGTSVLAEVATGDTFNSAFDFNPNELETTGEGIANFVGSFAYGSFKVDSSSTVTINETDVWHALDGSTSAGTTIQNATVSSGSVGSITALADAGGGQVTVTSATHGLSEGDYVTLNDINITGVYQISNVVTDTFEVTATFIATDTGSWQQGAYVELDQRGDYEINWNFGGGAVNSNQSFDFISFINTTEIAESFMPKKFASANDVGSWSSGALITAEKGDRIWFAMKNITSSGNIVIDGGSFRVKKQN